MENRFGLKDLVLIVLIAALGTLVVLGMIQDDRRWIELQRLRRELEAQSKRLREIQGLALGPDAASSPGRPSATGDAWARPGVPVTRPPKLGLVSDPTRLPGFAPGGTVTEVFEGQPATITPYRYTDTYGRRIVELVCEFLADYNPRTLELEGVLAEAWQQDPEGLWLRVKLDPRATFSDGHPVTAEDVRFTLHDFIQKPEIEADRFRSSLGLIRAVRVVSDLVLEFEFAEPRFNNTDQALRLAVLPAHVYGQLSPAQINASTGLLVGSGPFKLRNVDPELQWAPPSTIELVRNEQYWQEAPPLERLRFNVMTDAIARLAAIENDEADLVRPSSEQYARKSSDAVFLKNHRALAWNNIRSGYSCIVWNCGPRAGRPGPFADPRVRLAMTHLLDRERIRRDVYEGLGVIATGPFNPTGPQSDPAITPWPFDLQRAKSLLAEAGWADRNGDGLLEDPEGRGFEFVFTYTKGSEAGRKIGAYLKDQCALVGIRCQPQVTEWSVQQSMMQSRDFDAIMMQWSQNDPENDPYQLWHSAGIRDQGDNFAQWSNAEADRLMVAARAELDRTRRMGLWHRLHRIIHEEQPSTFILNPPWLRFVSARVENVNPHKTGLDPREWYIPTDRR